MKNEMIKMLDNFFEKHSDGVVTLLYPSETKYYRDNIHGLEITRKETYHGGRVKFCKYGVCIKQALGFSLVNGKHLFLPYGTFILIFNGGDY